MGGTGSGGLPNSKRKDIRRIQDDIIIYMSENLVDGKITGRHMLGKVLDRSPVGKQGAMAALADYVSHQWDISSDEVRGYEGKIDLMTVTQTARAIYDNRNTRRQAA